MWFLYHWANCLLSAIDRSTTTIHTYRSNDHVQRHRNIKIKRIVIAHLHDKKHGHHVHVGQIADFHGLGATIGRKQKALGSDKGKLQKRHQITDTRIQPVDKLI